MFEEIINIIRNVELQAVTVFKAIADGLELLYERVDNNETILNEMKGVYSSLALSDSVDNSSSEVVAARGGKEDLNARLVELESELATLLANNTPVLVKETVTERVPFGRTTEADPTLLPSQSYVKTAGVEGVTVVEITYETIRGVKQREVSRVVKSQTSPKNEVYVVGTKSTAANRPIRYIRFVSRLTGKQEGKWVEAEIFAGVNKLTNSSTKTMIQSGKTIENGAALLYDGVKEYWAAIIKAPNPYIQIDLGSERKDLTKASITLHPGSSYELVNIEVSSDNRTFYRVYSATNIGTAKLGQEVSIDVSVLYREDPLSTFTDTTAVTLASGSNSTVTDVPIGGTFSVRPNVSKIYNDAGVAAVKLNAKTYSGSSTSLKVVYKGYATNIRPSSGNILTVNSNTWVLLGSNTRPAGTYMVLYSDGVSGWFREDQL